MEKNHYTYYQAPHKQSGETRGVLVIGQTTRDVGVFQDALDRFSTQQNQSLVITVSNRSTSIISQSYPPATKALLKKAALMTFGWDLNDGTWTEDPAPAPKTQLSNRPQHKPLSAYPAPLEQRLFAQQQRLPPSYNPMTTAFS